MVKISISCLFISLALQIPSTGEGREDFYKTADAVLKGGKEYSLDDIQYISNYSDIPLHHRTIIEIQMLSSIEDLSRYQTAIEKATNYIESGDVVWAQDYLLMQRGFAYGLVGEREKGVIDFKNLLSKDSIDSFDSVNDPILEIMRKRRPNLAQSFDSIIKQSVGNYYMDFRKEGILPIEAYKYFNSIKIKEFREKCLERLKSRIGDEKYLEISGLSVSNSESRNPEKKAGSYVDNVNQSVSQEDDFRAEKTNNNFDQKVNNIAQDARSKSNTTNWVFGVLLIFVVVFIACRVK